MQIGKYFRDLNHSSILTKEILFSVLLFIPIVIFSYGLGDGLLIIAEWFSIISDAVIIVFSRDLVFRKRYDDKLIKGIKLTLPIFIILSLVLHSITFYFIGWRSFTLFIPMLVFLVSIYIYQKAMKYYKS